MAIVFLTESMFGIPSPPTVRPLEPSGFIVKRVRGASAFAEEAERAATSAEACGATGAATGAASAGAAAKVLSRAVTSPATSTEGRTCGTTTSRGIGWVGAEGTPGYRVRATSPAGVLSSAAV